MEVKYFNINDIAIFLSSRGNEIEYSYTDFFDIFMNVVFKRYPFVSIDVFLKVDKSLAVDLFFENNLRVKSLNDLSLLSLLKKINTDLINSEYLNTYSILKVREIKLKPIISILRKYRRVKLKIYFIKMKYYLKTPKKQRKYNRLISSAIKSHKKKIIEVKQSSSILTHSNIETSDTISMQLSPILNNMRSDIVEENSFFINLNITLFNKMIEKFFLRKMFGRMVSNTQNMISDDIYNKLMMYKCFMRMNKFHEKRISKFIEDIEKNLKIRKINNLQRLFLGKMKREILQIANITVKKKYLNIWISYHNIAKAMIKGVEILERIQISKNFKLFKNILENHKRIQNYNGIIKPRIVFKLYLRYYNKVNRPLKYMFIKWRNKTKSERITDLIVKKNKIQLKKCFLCWSNGIKRMTTSYFIVINQFFGNIFKSKLFFKTISKFLLKRYFCALNKYGNRKKAIHNMLKLFIRNRKRKSLTTLRSNVRLLLRIDNINHNNEMKNKFTRYNAGLRILDYYLSNEYLKMKTFIKWKLESFYNQNI